LKNNKTEPNRTDEDFIGSDRYIPGREKEIFTEGFLYNSGSWFKAFPSAKFWYNITI